MIRLVLLLGAGLFAAMLIGGQDRGQMRFGLMAVKQAEKTQPVAVKDIAVKLAVNQTASPPAAQVQAASFAPDQPVMAPPVEDVTAVTETADVPSLPAPDATKILFVAAKSVNVREGPGKDFGVVSRLSRGEAVLVVTAGTGPDGWSLIRIEGDGVEGYVASRFLTE